MVAKSDYTGRPTWSNIHSSQESWRKKLIGGIDDAFVVPRYVRLFYDTFGDMREGTFFEIGSGNGDLSRAILARNEGQIGRYVTSECFAEGVEWLQKQGLEAILTNAESLAVPDEAYDAAVEFDVMHHVNDPRKMAREMMRIGRGRCLLVESNGLSVVRKLKELTPGHRAAGERSYTPWRYKSFFEGHVGYQVTQFTIYPFLFPFRCPDWFLPTLVAFNHFIEKPPIARWQCSSVAITVTYERQKTE
jgi:hypothetical protein